LQEVKRVVDMSALHGEAADLLSEAIPSVELSEVQITYLKHAEVLE